MIILKCKQCGMEVDVNLHKRCPRCNAIVYIPPKCSECKGCSIYKSNGKLSMDCPSQKK